MFKNYIQFLLPKEKNRQMKMTIYKSKIPDKLFDKIKSIIFVFSCKNMEKRNFWKKIKTENMHTMKFKNGDSFPEIGLGTWLSKPNEVYNAVIEAIKCGYRHIDCAYIYGNEKEIGQALQFAFSNGMVKREDVFITSKLWNSDHAQERVLPAIKKSLKDLQLDYLDLYLIHWPIAFKPGHEQAFSKDDLASQEEIPVENTWEAMAKLCETGFTRHIGVSNFNIPKINKLIERTGICPEVNQVEMHPYFQQKKLLEFCQENNILVTAYSPLGSRHLVKTDAGIQYEPVVKEIAAKHNCSETQVLLAWGIKRGTSVIPKSVTPTRISDNLKAKFIELDNEDMKRLEMLDKNQRNSKGLFAVKPGGYYIYESIWEQ